MDWVILVAVKTAISLPDDLFDRATRSARYLGVSRSRLIATALTRHLDDLERTSLVADIDRAVHLAGDDSNAIAAAAGRRRLARVDNE